MPPDSLDADPTTLPRSFRGYHREATEELFRRVAWEYGVLAGEHRKLKKTMEEQQLAPRQPRGDLDEGARSLFNAVHKAVREMRESARAECEKALKKAKRRAAEIEQEADRAAVNSVAVIDAAAELRANLREALSRLEKEQPRSALTPTASSNPDEKDSAPDPAGLDHDETPGVP
jgi:cell division septum initiation protein DivIVA